MRDFKLRHANTSGSITLYEEFLVDIAYVGWKLAPTQLKKKQTNLCNIILVQSNDQVCFMHYKDPLTVQSAQTYLRFANIKQKFVWQKSCGCN